jgi:xylulokinase
MAAAQVGAGNEAPGRIMNTAGSSDMVSILTDRPVTDPSYYLRCAATPGLWQIYATTAGGFALDWFYQQFCQDMTRDIFDSHFLPKVLATDPGQVSFDPYLAGDRQCLELRTAAWHGLTLATTREQMLNALMIAMNQTLAATVNQAAQILPLTSTIRLSGGMSTSEIIALKERIFGGYTFEVVRNCCSRGSVLLMQSHYKFTQNDKGRQLQ